ncbi:MAG: transcriptional repressor LexA [Turicibacter sp.]
MKPITKRQQSILDFIALEVSKRGYPPSVREIGAAVGLSSTASVHNQLNQLEKKGFIRKDKSTTRGLVVLSAASLTPTSQEKPTNLIELNTIVNVPLVGKVTAGTPIEAIENPDEYFPLPTHMVPSNHQVFMLNVSGDSMINAGIYDGDQIIVKQQSEANNGDIVVAMIEDNEVTVKRFFKENGSIRLQPENDLLAPIIVNDVTIIGKVIGLFRNMK